MRPALTSAADPSLRPWHLSVDGMSPQGPNLSHWPGNRTPAEFKAFIDSEARKWGEIIKKVGITID